MLRWTLVLAAGLGGVAQAAPPGSAGTAAVVVAAAAAAPAARQRIVTVDLQQLFQNFHQAEELRKQLNQETVRIQRDANQRKAALEAGRRELAQLRAQLEDPTVAESKRRQLYQSWQAKRQDQLALEMELKEFVGRKERALQEKMAQRMKQIFEEIRRRVEREARTQDYDCVFDRSAQGAGFWQTPILLYGKDTTDITADVLKTLNDDAPPVTTNDDGRSPLR